MNIATKEHQLTALYSDLVNGLKNMIGDGRLKKNDIPTDFDWLTMRLEQIDQLNRDIEEFYQCDWAVWQLDSSGNDEELVAEYKTEEECRELIEMYSNEDRQRFDPYVARRDGETWTTEF